MNNKIFPAIIGASIIGSAATTFAAANPFSDVPQGHWAYSSVTKLAAEGIIEGYGDGTYMGNRNITRYEMAQMVAKALAKQPAGTNNAELEKLAAEFRDELDNLGVRVAELEKHADFVKWTGEYRQLYWNNKIENAAGQKPKKNTNRAELRLFPTATVNDHWKIYTRFTTRVDMKKDTTNDVKVTYTYAEGKYNHFIVAGGKMPFYSYNDEGLTTDEYFSGGRIEFGNKLKAILEAGRWNINNFGNASIAGSFANDEVANYQGIQVNYNGDKLFLGAGYRRFKSDGFKNLAGYSKNNNEDGASLVSFGAGYNFGSFRLFGAFAKNTDADNYDTSHNIQLSYKGANRKSPGSWGIYAAYRYISPFVTVAPTYDTMGFAVNRKGWEAGLSYAPLKNVVANISYFAGKQLDTDRDSNTLWARARIWF